MKPLGPRPNPLSLGQRIADYGFRAPALFLATGVYGSLALAVSLFEKSGRLQHRIAQSWARVCLRCAGTRVSVLNPEHLQPQTAVYVCNHLSYMDTPAIFGSLPFQFRIVARQDLWKLPFIGWYLERSGQVGVDLSDPRASISSLLGAVRTLKAGMPLFIFPEGGRSPSGHLQPCMKGPAFMAIRAQVPVVPMALIGTWELLPIHSSQFYPVPVTLAVGEPISTAGMTMKQVDQLTADLEDRIARLYYEHSWMERPPLPAPAESSPESVTVPQFQSLSPRNENQEAPRR